MAKGTFIDIHCHISLFKPPPRDGAPARISPPQMIRAQQRFGFERSVLMSNASPECAVSRESPEQILEVCRRFPGHFVPFCNVDPRAISYSSDAPLGRLLEHYRKQGARGVGEVTANLPFLDPMVANLFCCAEKVGLPLTFHVAAQLGGIYGLYDEPGLPGLERSLARFPNLKFFAHSQAFWAEMSPLRTPADRYNYPDYPVDSEGVVPRLFRRYPNLFGDLSANSGWNALARDPDYAVQFLTEFQDRLLFGTDIVSLPKKTPPLVELLTGLRDAGRIGRQVFDKVARENARRLLGLKRATRSGR